jgi:hypothetical protein
MRKKDTFIFLSGLVSLATNILAILSYFVDGGKLDGWRPDPGLLAVFTFALLAYGLVIWAVAVWRWTQPQASVRARRDRRVAAMLLNGLATFPLLSLWLYLLLSLLRVVDSSTERWLLSLALAWMGLPYLSLGMVSIGEALGPFLETQETDS